MRSVSFVIALLSVGVPTVGRSENSRFYDLEGFGNFLDGNPESVAVGEQGLILLPFATQEWHDDPTATYSAAAVFEGRVALARADDGRVQTVDAAGNLKDLATFEGRLITALVAQGSDLYVAAGPQAQIYRVRAGREPESVAELDADFVWAMSVGDRDELYVATGSPGTVVRIDTDDGKPNVIFEPEQEHIRSLALHAKLGLFAGGGERGVLYRAADRKNFRALYDSGMPEITAIVTDGEFAYVSAVSGAQALVNAQGAADGDGKEVNVRSQMVRVAMDGASETLAGSADEAVFAMASNAEGHVLVATGASGRDDPRGRVYAIDPRDREIALLYQSPSRRVTQLVSMNGNGVAAVAAAGGRVVRMTKDLAKAGEYFSAPFDTGINSRFGALRIDGSWPKGASVSAAIRSGQTELPDETWSEWSREIRPAGDKAPEIPNGRYLQTRLTLKGNGKVTPSVHRIRVAYLRQNLPPFVREVGTLEKGFALVPVPTPPPNASTVTLGGGVGDRVKNPQDTKKPSARARKVRRNGALTVRWIADDPNGDSLAYDLRYRTVGGADWTEIESELDAPFYTLNSSQLPDGHYQFQVRATDSPSNPDGVSMDYTRESRAVLIDNTSPVVERSEVRVDGRTATVRIAVADNVGPITVAEFALDGRDFRPMPPDDGVLDGAGESFTLRLPELGTGEHAITIRVRDEADNEGNGQARFRIR